MRSPDTIPTPDIDCVFQGFHQYGAIFISNLSAASDNSLIKYNQIGAVISIARDGYIHNKDPSLNYLYIPALDHESYDIGQHFQQTNKFIQKYRKTTNVLVHCIVGKSRSATIVAAYLIQKYRYSLGQVLRFLKRKRSKVSPNIGFIQQLQIYCKQIGVENSHQKFKFSRSTERPSNLRNKQKNNKITDKVKEQRIRLLSESSTTQSIEKQRKQQKQITKKLEDLRQRVMRSSRFRTNKSKIAHKRDYQLVESTISSTLPASNKTDLDWKQNKSLQFK